MKHERPRWVAAYVTLLVPAIALAGWALGEVRHGDPETLSVANLVVTVLVYGGAAAAASHVATRIVRLLERRRRKADDRGA